MSFILTSSDKNRQSEKGREVKNVSVNLKEIREKAGLSQQQLADQVGVGRTTITMIESGENTPSVDTAKKIGEVLGIEWSKLFED